jgi:DNA ligase (NAD+)
MEWRTPRSRSARLIIAARPWTLNLAPLLSQLCVEELNYTMDVDSAKVKHYRPIRIPEEGVADEDFVDFDRNLKESLGVKGPLQYTVEPKILGVAVQIAYESGTLSVAATVGDGYDGQIITANVKTILTVPLTLWRIGEAPPFPEYLEVRGDVYMEAGALDSLNQDRMGKGFSPFVNAVDAAEDSLRQANPRVAARRPLNMFCHAVGELSSPLPKSSFEMMVILQSWGFRVNRPHIRICDNLDELLEGCRFIRDKQAELPFPVQGALIQLNRLDLRVRQASGREVQASAFVYRF